MSTARHSGRAGRALRKLAEADPAVASLALWCRHRDDDATALPAWSDAATIHYGPAFERLTLHEQMGVSAHHVLHIAFRHAGRSRALAARLGDRFDAEVYAAAADALLNEALLLAGHVLPRPCVLASALLAETRGEWIGPGEAVARYDAERLYARLMAPGGGRGGAHPDGERHRGDPARAVTEHARREGHRVDIAPEGEAGAAPETGGDEAEWRRRLARALEAGRRAGRGIGALGHRIADLPEVHTPWERVLGRLLARAVADTPRPSWRRPAGRWLAMEAAARAHGGPVPVFQPSLRREGLRPRIAVCLDASASIDDGRLALFAAQVAGIARRTGAEVHLLVFDEAVRAREVLRPGRIEAAIAGVRFARGGGTAFAPALAEAAAAEPAIVVVLTDLEGPPGEPPGRVPVLWAVPEAPAGPPPFGRVIALDR